jgi:hypothetical protein
MARGVGRMGVETELEIQIGLNDVVWLIGLGAGPDGDMGLTIYQLEQGRTGDKPDHGAFVFVLKPLKRGQQKGGDPFVGRHDEIAGNLGGPAARSSGQLRELLLRRVGHAQKVVTYFGGRVTGLVAQEDARAQFGL